MLTNEKHKKNKKIRISLILYQKIQKRPNENHEETLKLVKFEVTEKINDYVLFILCSWLTSIRILFTH